MKEYVEFWLDMTGIYKVQAPWVSHTDGQRLRALSVKDHCCTGLLADSEKLILLESNLDPHDQVIIFQLFLHLERL